MLAVQLEPDAASAVGLDLADSHQLNDERFPGFDLHGRLLTRIQPVKKHRRVQQPRVGVGPLMIQELLIHRRVKRELMSSRPGPAFGIGASVPCPFGGRFAGRPRGRVVALVVGQLASQFSPVDRRQQFARSHGMGCLTFQHFGSAAPSGNRLRAAPSCR